MNKWSDDNLPEAGKNIIVVDEDGDRLFCFRCSCHSGCRTLKCALTGATYFIEPKLWEYCKEWPQVDEIDFFDLL